MATFRRSVVISAPLTFYGAWESTLSLRVGFDGWQAALAKCLLNDRQLADFAPVILHP